VRISAYLFSVFFEHQLDLVLPYAFLALLQFDHAGTLEKGQVSDLSLDALLTGKLKFPEKIDCLFGEEELEEGSLFLEEFGVHVLLFGLFVLGFVFGQLREFSLEIYNIYLTFLG
jgi:hypothetical protein